MSITLSPSDATGGFGSGERARARAADVNPAVTFTGFLACLEEGQLAAELTRELAQIQEALTTHQLDHGGEPKATLTIALNFQVQKGKQAGIDVAATVSVKTPIPPRGRTIMYASEDGRFTPHNPKQRDFFRDVNS